MKTFLAVALLALSSLANAAAPCSEFHLTCSGGRPTTTAKCIPGTFNSPDVKIAGSTYSATLTPGACQASPPPPPPPPSRALISGMTDVTPEAILPRPTRAASQTEPHWRSTINVAAVLAELPTDPHGGHPSWIRNDYSRHQAFNVDSTSYFLEVSTGYWAQFRASDRTFVKWIANLAGDAEPQWDTTDPNKLFYLAINGTSRQLYSQDVRTGVQVVEGNLGPAMDAIADCAGTTAAYTKAEGSPSADMRYWSFIGADASWTSRCLFVWDNTAKAIVGHMPTGGDNPDHISMTPDGRYVVPSWDTNAAAPGALAKSPAVVGGRGLQSGCTHPTISNRAPCDHTPRFLTKSDGTKYIPASTTTGKGTRAYDIHFTQYARLLHKSEHSDLGVLGNGHAYYASIDYQSNAGDVFFVDIDAATKYPASTFATVDAARTVLFPTYWNPATSQGGASGSFHFTAKGFNRPGYLFVGTYGDSPDRSTPPAHQWFAKRLEAWNLNASPPINFTISTQHTADDGGYEAETHMVVNRDATKALFNSNFGNPTDAGIQPFEIDIPAGAIP